MTITAEQFITVNVGSQANDGTGDSLREAFVKINDNFANIESIGFYAANISVDGAIEVSGNVTATGNVSAANFVGSGEFLTNLALGSITSVGTLANLSVTGNITAGANLSVTGNITAGANINVTDDVFASNVYADFFLLSNGDLPLSNYTFPAKFSSNLVVANVYVPTANSSPGAAGQITWDSGFVYICVATNTWKRASVGTW